MKWTAEEIAFLRAMRATARWSLPEIAHSLDRSWQSVSCKWQHLKRPTIVRWRIPEGYRCVYKKLLRELGKQRARAELAAMLDERAA